ncbi:putative Inosine-5'-monophosphate dehydrogenase [groundwater metagenome]|uniref:Putative Inosine-5'-monophosphate dehydrogenase n=1 Tax=groundwater metagenome TaxID=717931 RepID=A0A098E8A7_9ZZZZ
MKRIEETKVKDIMTYGAITVPENTSVMEAVNILVDGGVHGIVVINQRREPIGVVSEADIPKAFGRNFDDVQVTEIMYSPPEVIEMNKSVKDAREIMQNRHIHRLIVTDDSKEMRGILSLTDIIREIYKISHNVRK